MSRSVGEHLSEREVKAIYMMAHTTNMTSVDIGFLFNVSDFTVNRIRNGQIYSYVTKYINLNQYDKTDMDSLIKYRKVNDYKEQDIIDTYNELKSVMQTAKKCNVKYDTAYRILDSHNLISKKYIKEKYDDLKKNYCDEIVELYNGHSKTVKEITELYEISTKGLYKILSYAQEKGLEIIYRQSMCKN